MSTPAALLAAHDKGRLFYSAVSSIVVDEADMLFDESFIQETSSLLSPIFVATASFF